MDNIDINDIMSISVYKFLQAIKKCKCKNKISFIGSVNFSVVIVDRLGLGTKWTAPIDIDTAIIIIDR